MQSNATTLEHSAVNYPTDRHRNNKQRIAHLLVWKIFHKHLLWCRRLVYQWTEFRYTYKWAWMGSMRLTKHTDGRPFAFYVTVHTCGSIEAKLFISAMCVLRKKKKEMICCNSPWPPPGGWTISQQFLCRLLNGPLVGFYVYARVEVAHIVWWLTFAAACWICWSDLHDWSESLNEIGNLLFMLLFTSVPVEIRNSCGTFGGILSFCNNPSMLLFNNK